jgi:hypothetical protein
MPLQLALRPDHVLDIAKYRLALLARTGGFLTPLLRQPGPGDLSVSTWHRVLFLGLDRLVGSEHPIGTAPELGWRLFVHRGERIVAAIEVRRTDDSGIQPGPLTEGPFVDGTVRAFHEAEMSTADQAGNYEPILLVAPALHVSGLWLRAESSLDGIILPVAPIDPPFTPCERLSVASFEATVRKLARIECQNQLPPRDACE